MLQRLRDRDDTGAMAILLSVVMIFFAVPAAGFAATQLVRDGLQGELQRAADQGSIAGAAVIPLADTGTLQSFVASTPSGIGSTAGLIPSSYCTKGPAELGQSVSSTTAAGTCPRDIACRTALTSLLTDTGFAKHYALQYGAPTCTASYLDDTSFFSQLDSCVTSTVSYSTYSLTNLLSVPSLNTILTPILNTLTSSTSGLLNTAPLALSSLLPALLQPGVQVSISFQERGPFDSLTSGDNGQTHTMTRTASATRSFKNLVVVPEADVSGTVSGLVSLTLSLLGLSVKNAPTVGPGTDLDINLNPTVRESVSTILGALSSINTIIGSVLPNCSGAIGYLENNASDLLNPPSTGPQAINVINQAVANASPLYALVIPTNITSGTEIPFLDFVPICLSQAGTVNSDIQAVVENTASGTPATLPSGISSVGSCTTAAPGIFRGRLAS